jgi:16S rRNA (guanine966-N2)-methyltransferase
MRVIGGTARGRRLVAPHGTDVRPTGDRVREAVFNTLGSMDEVVGRRYLDLFAGSGALGLEALSRGAEHCVFVDSSRRSLRTVRDNVASLGFAERSEVIASDALRYLRETDPTVDVALVDPPYAFDDWSSLLRLVPARLVVAESDRPVAPPAGSEVLRERRYGGTVVTMIQLADPEPRPADSEDAP